jgi:peptidase M1-like protein
MKRALVMFGLWVPATLAGQAPAGTYRDRYTEIVGLSPVPGVADVNHIVITRDVGRLTLERGKLYLLSAVGGRTVGAVFSGQGHFAFAPAVPAEQAELQRFSGAAALDDTITEAILVFSDSTAEQLHALTFAPGEIPGDVQAHVHDLIASLKGENDGSFSSDVLRPLLNGEATGFFLARLTRAHGDPILFEIDPDLSEAVQLFRSVGKLRWGTNWAVVARFPAMQPLAGAAGMWRYRDRLAIPRYRMEVALTPTGGADLDFAATATLTAVAQQAVGPWLLFGLHPKLQVDSVRWGRGASAAAFKAKDDDDLWVQVGRQLQPGDTVTLVLFYHGNLIDRYDNWFYIDPTAAWYPTNQQGQDLATFDITYHSPSWYPIASIGNRTDSTVDGKVLTTRWVTQLPTPFATFNLGLFENHRVQQPGAPVLDVLISEDAHRLLRRQLQQQGLFLAQQRNMREVVAADVSNSLKWFTHLFGECSWDHFWVTEIPYFEGVSFPGMIDLSWSTFQNSSLDGFDEFFRAHEVAHQWWGNGVRPASYRDAWLSEGLASFSALWYLQTLRKRNTEYLKFLDTYEMDIRGFRNDVGPIWLGYRNASPGAPVGYQVMIYEKGAWVFHMLRTLMLDLQTMKEDRFTAMMQDFYTSYRGQAATTEDFQRVVERHAGIPMDWFFDEWVKGTAIPTYHVAWKTEPADGGKFRVRFRVTQEDVPPNFQMWVLVSADLGNNRFANFRVGVRGGQTDYVSPLLPAAPTKVIFNELNSVLADVKMERW